jgi:hypothetical protein
MTQVQVLARFVERVRHSVAPSDVAPSQTRRARAAPPPHEKRLGRERASENSWMLRIVRCARAAYDKSVQNIDTCEPRHRAWRPS